MSAASTGGRRNICVMPGELRVDVVGSAEVWHRDRSVAGHAIGGGRAQGIAAYPEVEAPTAPDFGRKTRVPRCVGSQIGSQGWACGRERTVSDPLLTLAPLVTAPASGAGRAQPLPPLAPSMATQAGRRVIPRITNRARVWCLSFSGQGDHRTPSSGLAQPRHTRPASCSRPDGPQGDGAQRSHRSRRRRRRSAARGGP
jgi:hypothetical protein